MSSPATVQLADDIARRASELTHGDVPTEVISAAKDHILDAIGVAMAAASTARGGVTLDCFGTGESTVIGDGARLTASSAALLNGRLMHSLEYDDTHVPSVIHGSAVVVPAALAVAERVGSSGADLVTAVIAGWELLIRLGLSSPGRFQAAGFQTVAVVGPFASAVVAGRLSAATDDTIADALGICGSQASGTFEFLSDGSSVKAVHPGWAAHSGVLALDLARLGVTGPRSVFDGRFGVFRSYARDEQAAGRLEGLMGDFGVRWLLPEAAFKLHPCCHYIHSFVECAERLRADGLEAEDVEELRCQVPVEEATIICEPWESKQEPVSAAEVRFSLPVCIAAMLCHGRLALADFGELPRDEQVLALAQRISWEPWPGSGFPDRFPARVQVTTRGGGTLRVEVEEVRGSAARPLATEDVFAKFHANAELLIGAEQAEELASYVRALEDQPDVTHLRRLLRAPSVTSRPPENEAR